ncbi:MAG: response regulator transcription factor [Leptolyngbyaceae cyanobacterium SM2_3_12]|nr:response regulator transcription factor [Leptolyngbyaceae cyanobacterium SM2_3_12]
MARPRPAAIWSAGGIARRCHRARNFSGPGAALAGLITLHPSFIEDLSSALLSPLVALAPQLEPPLTPRETEILNLITQGASNKTIAQALFISEHTVKFHLSAIFAKLGVSTRTEAALAGARLGIVLL